MKKILLSIVIAAITLTSCSSDDSNTPGENIAEIQNATEETAISAATLEEGIVIEGASKETGTAPSPNSTMSFELNTSLTEAFQSTGMNIQFSSDEQVSGAYVQFKDTDGNPTDSYFDIPSNSFNTVDSERSSSSRKSLLKTAARSLEEGFEDQIEINFTSTIPAGEFCYDICLYDSDNNVFQVQTACVTVEAWGGNDSIVGEWVLDSVEGGFVNDILSLQCDNGQTISVNSEQTISLDLEFTINQDGTLNYLEDSVFSFIDQNTTEENCTATYDPTDLDNFNEKLYGNWAFNEDNQTLTVIFFRVENFLEPEFSYESEEGELLFEGYSAEIISDQLVLTDNSDDSNIVIYLNRK